MSTRIFSTDTDSGLISIIEKSEKGEHRRIAQISVGNEPRGSVKFTRSGRGFVGNCAGNTVSEIDALTLREVAKIQVGAAPRGVGIIPGDRFFLVSNSGSNYVSVVDIAKRAEVGQISVGRDPRHMAITSDGSYAYVSIWGSHYISKIDTRGLAADTYPSEEYLPREVSRISVGDGAHPYSVNIHPSGRHVFVANNQVSYVSVINTETDAVEHQIDLGTKGSRAIVFTPDGENAVVSVEDTSEVVVVDVADMSVINRLEVGPGPRGIAFDPRDMTLYSSSFSRSTKAEKARIRTPNSLTALSLMDDIRVASEKSHFQELPVGAGPCSVSLFNVEPLQSSDTDKSSKNGY